METARPSGHTHLSDKMMPFLFIYFFFPLIIIFVYVTANCGEIHKTALTRSHWAG